MTHDASAGEPGSAATWQLAPVAVLLTGILALATLGEGGGSAGAIVAWHGAVALLVGLAVLTARPLGLRSGRVPVAVLWPLAAFAALFLAGALRAPYGYASLLTALELACCVAVAWSAGRIGWVFVRIATWPLLVVAALHGLYAGVQWLQGVRRPASTFLNTNHLALWIAAVLLLSLGSLRGARGARLGIRVLLLGLAAAGLVLSGSRGATLALLLGAGSLVWIRWSGLLPRWRLAVGAVALALVCLAAWGLVRRQGHADPFRYHRLPIWKASLGMVALDPWWGSGPGQFSVRASNLGFADGDGPLRFDRKFSQTHSDLLRLPSELGIPAAVALLLAAALVASRMRLARLARTLPPEADGAIAALVAMLVHALVDNPSQWPAIYLLGSALAGVLISTPGEASGVSVRPLRRWLLATSILLLYGLADLGPYLAWRDLRGLPRGRLDPEQQARLVRALRLNPIHPDTWLRRAEHLVGDGTDWDLDRYAEARESAERAIRLSPLDARFEIALGRIEARASTTILSGRATRDRAIEHFLRAEALSRHDPFIPLLRATLLIDTGDPAGALRAAERSLSLEPEAVLPRLVLADALFDNGDAERAGRVLADARERARRWADWRGSPYGKELLQPSPSVFARLDRRLGGAVDLTAREDRTSMGTP